MPYSGEQRSHFVWWLSQIVLKFAASQVAQYYSDVSLIDANTNAELTRQRISVNVPFRCGHLFTCCRACCHAPVHTMCI